MSEILAKIDRQKKGNSQ